MPTNDDVFYFQNFDGVLQNTQHIQVGMDAKIGDVAMNKNFAGSGLGDFIGRHAAVGATNPEEIGGLDIDQSFKILGVVFDLIDCP